MQARQDKILLVLDLNGTLLCKVTKFDKRAAHQNPFLPPKASFKCNKAPVYVRPHLGVFLEFLFENFAVAAWTSAQPSNAKALATGAFGQYFEQLEFLWDRTHCSEVRGGRHDHSSIKDLRKIWDADGRDKLDSTRTWSARNTILLDDTASKASYTTENHLKIPTFTVLNATNDQSKDRILLNVMNYLLDLKSTYGGAEEKDVRISLMLNKLLDASLDLENRLDDVPKMVSEAKKKATSSDWDSSLELFSTALEIMNQKYGELAPECADTYFLYGRTLLSAALSRKHGLGVLDPTVVPDVVDQDNLESVQGNPFVEDDQGDWDGEGDTGLEETDKEGLGQAATAIKATNMPVEGQPQEVSSAASTPADEKDDMELAFEILDICRVIYTKMDTPDAMAKLGDVKLMQGDITLDAGHYKQAIMEYAMAISLKQVVNAPHRELAEAHYKLALPLEYEGQHEEAIKQIRLACTAVKQRIQLLNEELKGAGVEVDAKGKGKVAREGPDPINSEILEMESIVILLGNKIADLMAMTGSAYLTESGLLIPPISSTPSTKTDGSTKRHLEEDAVSDKYMTKKAKTDA
ncbi:hypothetical protein SmJEL517_g05595 [Synchytrium microbalum]|uniref:FCP1 homology domain-containing protein n=1 Tax=Synchytrium microbalum TaxID=1806994 RepID=A0A507BVH0_9FUNG|nr:uncharacterized protein SmJEL517_g05595 [Synchytrium microbalum]TPX30939.1 hypothetical protein SmJEL517_g05595 [Synchytrium microbalum]